MCVWKRKKCLVLPDLLPYHLTSSASRHWVLCVFWTFACVKRDSLNTWNENQQVLFFQYKFQTNWFYYHFIPLCGYRWASLYCKFILLHKSLCVCMQQGIGDIFYWSLLAVIVFAWCFSVCADTKHCICWRSHQCLSAASRQYRFYRLVWLEPVARSSSTGIFLSYVYYLESIVCRLTTLLWLL